MSGALFGGIVLVLLAGAGALFATTLRVRQAAHFVLAAYVTAYASVVVLCLVLSLFDAMTRLSLVAGSGAVFVLAGVAWVAQDAPPPHVVLGLRRVVSSTMPLLVLAVIAVLAFAYVAALVFGTPPNGSDQLNYHLPRAALWIEADRVAYVPHAYDQRINSFAPNGEISVAFMLDVTRNEVFAASAQFLAALASVVGVFALGRQLRLRPAEALFGALLFATLPIVLLQAASTKNDMILASFLIAAAVFLLGESRAHLFLAGLATALAVGTKFTAFYGVVVLIALAFIASPRSARPLRLVAVAGGALVGLYWYAVNVVETGKVFGNTSAFHGLTAVLQPRENAYSLVGLLVDSLDVSGARGADILLYPAAAVVVAAGLTLIAFRSSDPRWTRVVLASALVVSPLLIYVLATDLGRPGLLRWLHFLGDPPAYIPSNGNPTLSARLASDTGSWFGPVGVLLALGVGATAIVLFVRGALPQSAVLFASAPFAWWLFVGLTLTYLPWQGRFFLFPVALSAALWGLVVRIPQVAWAVTALAAVTASLSLVHYAEKPSGVRLLDRDSVASVWHMPRWKVQSLELHPPPMATVLRFIGERIPTHDSIALALSNNDYGYPAFDAQFVRRVELVPFGSSAADVRTEWLIASHDREAEIDMKCWRAALRSQGGTVFKRAARCRTPA